MIDSLLQVVQLLEDCRIPYMITGSFASNLHGTPRTTYDADIVIEATRDSLDSFLAPSEASGTSVWHRRTGLSKEPRCLSMVRVKSGAA